MIFIDRFISIKKPTKASIACPNTDGTSKRPNEGLLDQSNESFDVLIGKSNETTIDGQNAEYSKDVEVRYF